MHGKEAPRVYFRGQKYYHEHLLPMVRKTIRIRGTENRIQSAERDLLHHFCRWAYTGLNRRLDEWEAIFLARHHGLPVAVLPCCWLRFA
ncbi:MAG: FRG domain-containing protein [Chloroflexi bacterium]|nr:FRG domain-containing protein [Chloroflexota bacterium]